MDNRTLDQIRRNETKLIYDLMEVEKENKQLKDNWNKLKEWLYTTLDINCCELIEDKMQKLEKGEYENE